MKKNKKNEMKFRGGKEQIGRSWTADGSRTPLTQKHFCCKKTNSDAEVEIMQSTQGLEESKSKSNSVDKFLGYKWPRFPKSNPIGGYKTNNHLRKGHHLLEIPQLCSWYWTTSWPVS
jgi:hypothetical protein